MLTVVYNTILVPVIQSGFGDIINAAFLPRDVQQKKSCFRRRVIPPRSVRQPGTQAAPTKSRKNSRSKKRPSPSKKKKRSKTTKNHLSFSTRCNRRVLSALHNAKRGTRASNKVSLHRGATTVVTRSVTRRCGRSPEAARA